MFSKAPTARAGDASRWAEFTELREPRKYRPTNYQAQRLTALRHLSRIFAERKWLRSNRRFALGLSELERIKLARRIDWREINRRLVAIERGLETWRIASGGRQ